MLFQQISFFNMLFQLSIKNNPKDHLVSIEIHIPTCSMLMFKYENV